MKITKHTYMLIALVMISCLIMYILFRQETQIEFMNNYKIPKKIWTFWDGELTETIKLCIDSWRKHNSDYEIVILNKENIDKYLPDFDFKNLKHADDIRHFSDIIRLHIIEKYGGIWSDASIICYDSYDWILDIQQEKQIDFVGYWINNDIPYSPVIENWFFATAPNSTMITDWKNELMESQNYDNRDDYINYLLDNCNAEKVNGPSYLWMHVAMQKLLQENKGKYKYELFPATNAPFKYLEDNDWDNQKAIADLIRCNNENTCKDKYGSFIKMTGRQRAFFDEMDNKQRFFK